jgi:hypothetical protein
MTRYHGTFDTSALLSKLSLSPSIEQQVKRMLGGGVPIDAWVDAQGRIRKVALEMSILGSKLSESIEFYDFGVPVDVVAPAGATDVKTRAQERAAQSDLRNALTAEKTVYTDNQEYSDDAKDLKAVESSLDWGGALTVVVGDALTPGDNGVVCLSERSKSGVTFSIADVSAGTRAGTYYGKTPCPAAPTPGNVAAFDTSW